MIAPRKKIAQREKKFVDGGRTRCKSAPVAASNATNQPTNHEMKTLINITAHAYAGNKLVAAERTYSFVRAASAKKPTHAGAARMVAAELRCKPADVSVTRVEAMCYAV